VGQKLGNRPGLCKKVLIADRLADFVDPLLGGASPLSFLSGWLALLGYTFQIYFDFSGYSDMAIGLGRLFAIELPQNFDRPYCAVNPGDFWRRWHITLSQWLRDYLYIPLGGNRCSRAERDRNVMITMVLGGLWHGARWTFAAWGLYHGCLLIVWGRLREPWERLPVFLQRSLTFLLVSVGWLPFRAPSFTLARSWAAALLGRHGWGWEVLDPRLGAFLGLLAVAAAVVQLVPPASRWPGWDTLGNLGQFFLAAASAGAVLLLNYSSRFLYFQF
jgi:alginate O-acetyltransferase complex protein AlgI